jgi:TM2 domain-containing membrane protein YozV
MSNEVQNTGKDYVATLLLSWFLGGLGVHRFYTGYIGIGVAQLLTGGGCGIWALIDFVSICLGNYEDANGQPLVKYNPTFGKVALGIWVALVVLSFIMYTTLIASVGLNSVR